MPHLPSFTFAPMRADFASAIAAWRYPGAYAFYDWSSDPDDLAELLDEASWPNCHFAAITEDGAAIGFLQLKTDGDAAEIGLGLRPDLTGRGYGRAFLDACMTFATEQYAVRRFTLSVVAFNRRAITVYERAGFRVNDSFTQHTNGGEYQFLRMDRSPRGK